jgi:hypothetical protein
MMKRNQLQTKGSRVMKIAGAPLVLILSLAATAIAQPSVVNAIPAAALSFASAQAPKGVKVLARVSLDGQPVTRMYTQWASGRTYLYIENGREQLITVDVTKKQHPKVVNHDPAQVQPHDTNNLLKGA